MSDSKKAWLTADQVYSLNEKHGWFQFGDAQSDVSRAFVQDAIEMHERLRQSAPDLLKALLLFVKDAEEVNLGGGDAVVTTCESLDEARAVIARATGARP